MPVKNKELKKISKYILSVDTPHQNFEQNKKIVGKYLDRYKYKKQANQIAGLITKIVKKKNDSK